MSYTREDAYEDVFYELLYNELGPQWAADHGYDLYEDNYEAAIKEFTAERLRSYYLRHVDLALPALGSLQYAQSLIATHPIAATVFAATAIELAVKMARLTPIVHGLVHTEALASFITDLITQHKETARFRTLLTAILKQFGGVELETFRRTGATKALWEEIAEVQKARNGIVHRGETPTNEVAQLGTVVASTILNEILLQVLGKLELHQHEPGTVCGARHNARLPVTFTIPTCPKTVTCTVEIDNTENFDFNAAPPAYYWQGVR